MLQTNHINSFSEWACYFYLFASYNIRDLNVWHSGETEYYRKRLTAPEQQQELKVFA